LVLVGKAIDRIPIRLLAYCLMPNHFHFVIWPYKDGDLSRWMQWLLTAHVKRYHHEKGTSGRIWQGRFKAFPIQQDRHLLTVMRYVERNPVRANLVKRSAEWRWSSLSDRERAIVQAIQSVSPVTKPPNWVALVDEPHSQLEIDALRHCRHKNKPYGSDTWVSVTAKRLGLESSLRGPGKPKSGHS
jgi:putative transposase